ncbi:acetamidase/formamidase family protein [Brevibacillus sp. 179-C 1.1 NHS]|uniref:acetamidase/formamidase family protein n=1 Tax=Brevibacillus sp. 179-C 1.1 NHS TaxID=3235177 RepID=UPI0039A26039
MAEYFIRPERSTLHGSFSKDLPPILFIHSGDTVRFETLEAGWNVGPFSLEGERKKFCTREHPRDSGHALIGPLYIHGANVGKTLAIQINDLRISNWGWSSGGGFPSVINKRLELHEGEEFILNWELDARTLIGSSHLGHKIKLRPFMGIMGMPTNEDGFHSTYPPRFCGGNIDCKELVPGSILYLPIAVEGGLFSVGDGHAVQGDGEVSSPALECPMELVDLTFTVLERSLSFPRAETSTCLITFGFHEDVHEAAMIALDGMLDWMQELHRYERKEALNLASLLVDLRITQLVNGVRGVHAILSKDAILP